MKTEEQAALLVAAFKGEIALNDKQVKGLKPAVAEFVGFVNGVVNVSPIFDKMTEDPNSATAVDMLSNLAQTKDAMERGTIVRTADTKVKNNAAALFEVKEPAPVAKPVSKTATDPSTPPAPPKGLLDTTGVAADRTVGEDGLNTIRTGTAGEEALVADERRDDQPQKRRDRGSDKHAVDAAALALALQSTNERAIAEARVAEVKAIEGRAAAEAKAAEARVKSEEIAERTRIAAEKERRKKVTDKVLETRGSGSTATKGTPAVYNDPRKKASAAVPAPKVKKGIPLWILTSIGLVVVGGIFLICSGILTGSVAYMGAPPPPPSQVEQMKELK